MRALYSPVIRTDRPSIIVSRAAPPPMDSPRAVSSSPLASRTHTSTVLGWETLDVGSASNDTASPRSRAICRESRMRRSSVWSPSIPAASARSVPWPRYVRANDPYSVNRTSAGGASKSSLTICAMRSAPAVCDDDGPTMMGPRTSLRPKLLMAPPRSRTSVGGDCFGTVRHRRRAWVLSPAARLRRRYGRGVWPSCHSDPWGRMTFARASRAALLRAVNPDGLAADQSTGCAASMARASSITWRPVPA